MIRVPYALRDGVERFADSPEQMASDCDIGIERARVAFAFFAELQSLIAETFSRQVTAREVVEEVQRKADEWSARGLLQAEPPRVWRDPDDPLRVHVEFNPGPEWSA